ncbi:MAG TPA: pilus assembly protein TadG-related protein [Acetobacteraceae bacterium]|nr:pilus assembly protein TadG-related protein [Acetobacteraceae bacterium]
MSPRPRIIDLLASIIRHERGVSTLLVSVASTALLLITGLVVDLGNVLAVQRALQASTDAAALAGARQINCCTGAPNQAITTATTYSAVAGGMNQLPGQTVTMVSGYPVLKCFQSTGVSCSGVSGANGIVVRQQTTVTTWFAAFAGITSISIGATATAGVAGGVPQPLAVELILDTTASMNTTDPNCSLDNGTATRIACARAGAQEILTSLSPAVDYVGMMVFPGLTSATNPDTQDYCSATTPSRSIIAAYSASPNYQITSPSLNNYQLTKGALSGGALAQASGTSGCNGVYAIGGVGTYYAAAITQAQQTLQSLGQPNAQNVIILLSDGQANASASNVPKGAASNQCKQAVTAAQSATAAGTWVYAVAYGASSSGCTTDTSPYSSSCYTMQNIASSSAQFYADSCANAQSFTDLLVAFKSIASSLVGPRLLPDNTN